MLTVWVYDGDAVQGEKLCGRIRESVQGQTADAAVRRFQTAGELRIALEEETPELLFAEVGNGEGFAIAEEIRESGKETEIVFVDEDGERMQEAFGYRAIGYLIKPINRKDIESVTERFFGYYRRPERRYAVHTRGQNVSLPMKEILYFESSGHRVLVHTGKGEPLMQIRRLDEIEKTVTSELFVRVHKSYLVRAAAMIRLDRTRMRVRLTNGQDLPVSRSHIAHVTAYFSGKEDPSLTQTE